MANKVISVGLCAFGMSGKLFHAPFIDAHPKFNLRSIVERHREDSRDLYPHARLNRSIEDLCADNELELIVVNTPSHLHYDHAKLLLSSGKHLIVEKPFTLTVAQAMELKQLAEEKKLFLSVYQNRRYDGDYLAVRKVIEDGVLGELKEVEIRYDRYRPNFGGKHHKEGNLPGAGILYDLSPHLVDQAIQLFGFPTSVFADLIKMRDDVEAPDYFEILLYYPHLRVRLKATCIARETTYAYVLHGMRGSFLQHRSDLQEQNLQLGIKPSVKNWCPAPSEPDGVLHTQIRAKPVRKETTSLPGNYMGYYDDVYKAILGKGENPVPAAHGILNMAILEAALQSAEERRVIDLAVR